MLVIIWSRFNTTYLVLRIKPWCGLWVVCYTLCTCTSRKSRGRRATPVLYGSPVRGGWKVPGKFPGSVTQWGKFTGLLEAEVSAGVRWRETAADGTAWRLEYRLQRQTPPNRIQRRCTILKLQPSFSARLLARGNRHLLLSWKPDPGLFGTSIKVTIPRIKKLKQYFENSYCFYKFYSAFI